MKKKNLTTKLFLLSISGYIFSSMCFVESVKAQDFVEDSAAEGREEILVEEEFGGTIPDIIFGRGEALLRDQATGVVTFVEDLLGTVNPSEVSEVIENTAEVIRGIGIEDITIENIETVLGAIGLLNPQEAAIRTATESTNYGNPASPREVDELSQATDADRAKILQNLSQITFSEEGQEATAEENEILVETQENSLNTLESAVQTYEASAEVSTNQIPLVDEIATEAQAARDSVASQDVLKALATQEEYKAAQIAGLSDQAALLTSAAIYNSSQLDGINNQLTISNQRQQTDGIYMAAAGVKLGEIDNNQEQQLELYKRDRQQKIAQQHATSGVMFLPGLISTPTDN